MVVLRRLVGLCLERLCYIFATAKLLNIYVCNVPYTFHFSTHVHVALIEVSLISELWSI